MAATVNKYVRAVPWPFAEHPAWGKAEIVGDPRDGQVVLVPPRKSVAIVGFADSCRELAPFDDPTWEIWGLNHLARYIPRAERWFEIHEPSLYQSDGDPASLGGHDYLAWLRACPVPCYMLEALPDFPHAVRYPLERVTAFFGREYLTSTPAYMLALAIMEGFERVGIYGIDLIVGREYFFEKPCMEYWLGQAEARGIEIVIPYPQSALLKQGTRYGLAGSAGSPEVSGRLAPSHVTELKRTLEAKFEELKTALHQCEGALQATRTLLEADEVLQRGGTVPGFQA